ncbi:MAG: hypothetical protein PHP95_05300 [Desulfuromonadaceae bacterium]|nr:hypothetical protein [Desulfuromonadaceae bacterium]MDD2847855.1 hypothetical protein [Desulfuromonadaceae bacterium]MDD4129600.1 hypothetical protein [Desulfuromonadaceae bacterium]
MHINRLTKLAHKALLFTFIFGFSLFMLLYAAQKSDAATSVQGNQYQANHMYKGKYISSVLYFRNSKTEPWMRMSNSDNYLDVVTCRSALLKIKTEGLWAGHFNRDGSCGTMAEPTTFVLGNRLNLNDDL